MTDLVLLLDDTAGRTPEAGYIREVVEDETATVASQHTPEITENGLVPEEFVNCQYRGGVNLSSFGDDFRMRDILLLKTPKPDSVLNFVFVHLWNWESSTYDIDAVRIPYEGETDPRNNPKGKNPGNIWSFSERLNDSSPGTQSTLFAQADPDVVGGGHVEVEAVERLIDCHTTPGDSVHVWATDEDSARIRSTVEAVDRSFVSIPEGSPEPATEIPVVVEQPDQEDETETDSLLPDSIELPDKGAKYFITDCREGLSRLPTGSIEDVVTSPPYNIAYDPFNVPVPDPVTGEVRSPLREGYQDDMPAEHYHYLLRTTFEGVDSKLSGDSADVFVNIKNNYSGGDCRPPFWLLELVPEKWAFSDLLVWRYDISYDPAKNKYKPYYEWVFRFSTGDVEYPSGHAYFQDYYIPIVKGNSKEREGLKHPAIYPKELVKQCLEISQHDGLVVDPFLGSGTTLAAAQEMGRRAVGFEQNSRFEDDIQTRLERSHIPESRQ